MTSGPIVVDASVVVEYLVDLGQTDYADRVFRRAANGDLNLWAPDLIYAECTSALRKLVVRKAIRTSAGARAVAQLERLPLRVTGTLPLLSETWQLRGTITPYDACYVALSRRLDVPLLTADEKLARSLRRGRLIRLSQFT